MIVRTADELREVVRARRRELGLSQEELADVIGAHRAFVSQFERGRTAARFDLVLKLLHALGLDVDLKPRGQ
jgi:HTH-type transcriptional regulator/antitoxin HipB